MIGIPASVCLRLKHLVLVPVLRSQKLETTMDILVLLLNQNEQIRTKFGCQTVEVISCAFPRYLISIPELFWEPTLPDGNGKVNASLIEWREMSKHIFCRNGGICI